MINKSQFETFSSPLVWEEKLYKHKNVTFLREKKVNFVVFSLARNSIKKSQRLLFLFCVQLYIFLE